NHNLKYVIKRMGFGMQLNNADKMAINISEKFSDYFNEKIENISISKTTDTPYTMFTIQFTLYNYFNIIFNYNRDAFGCSIVQGDVGIKLKNSQKWYDKADMNVFLQELQQQLERRIPDKFLEYNGWK